ncbi:ORF A-45 [Sulfolobus spindle-shaped virus 1]|uniref:Uncharacterized protein A-45 n=1 Tax=Sulfolobus spindle-shape virus 1 TaxID=244589 RepID=A45_SSV1|nr:ORF A-45 [Sulfolobus spindle-shaped virus 1]P20198.1 RecName: Full=Uncharacterized protein A-45 [Sulfolobus spindle-shaped virus 1]CAA30195.1 ORF A-45 [Sulfolobus spindle-shaped virus 1]
MYQCLRCGGIFNKRREVVEHLLVGHKHKDRLTLDFYYIYFRVRGQ